ncbi:hypothetical protein TNCV_1358561 [Trichonephila clavipes]|uniref:Uncharacterized protein n=1 Tax=Trichonephila clavipes TaxID=2585209 RepID=A0A8X6V850_TRICX|nr:hypothetical protein TNCV_1358561 [Trichonephila clavipes]
MGAVSSNAKLFDFTSHSSLLEHLILRSVPGNNYYCLKRYTAFERQSAARPRIQTIDISLHAEIVEVEIEVVSPSIVPSGNFVELNRTVTCMVLKANDRRTSCPCHDEFRGPRSDYVRQSSVIPDLGVVELGVVEKAATTTSYTSHTDGGGNVEHYQITRESPGFRLLRWQSSQSGHCQSRQGLRKLDSSYGPRGRRLGRRGQASVQANLPDHPAQSIPLDMLYPMRTSALKCAGAPPWKSVVVLDETKQLWDAGGYDGPMWSIASTSDTTSRDDRQIVRMASSYRSVTLRTVA